MKVNETNKARIEEAVTEFNLAEFGGWWTPEKESTPPCKFDEDGTISVLYSTFNLVGPDGDESDEETEVQLDIVAKNGKYFWHAYDPATGLGYFEELGEEEPDFMLDGGYSFDNLYPWAVGHLRDLIED